MSDGIKDRFDHLRYDFDYPAFIREVEKAALGLGLRQADISRETGISAAQLCDAKRGRVAMNARYLMTLVAWSGVDPRPFVIDRDDAQFNVTSRTSDQPTSFRQAVAIIQKLRSELERRGASA